MSTPEAGFLQAILDEPDSDTPRLIYADWLEEQGDPRGEFIRLQVELAELEAGWAPYSPISAKHPAVEQLEFLRRREGELLEKHGADWCEPLARLFSVTRWTYKGWSLDGDTIQFHQPTWEWSRGFVDAITCTVADFLLRAGAVFRAVPIREVRLTNRKPNHASSAFHDELSWDWWEFDPWGRQSASAVGPELFDLLDGGTKDAGGRRYCEYPTEQVAIDALSVACVKYGRAMAERSLVLEALP